MSIFDLYLPTPAQPSRRYSNDNLEKMGSVEGSVVYTGKGAWTGEKEKRKKKKNYRKWTFTCFAKKVGWMRVSIVTIAFYDRHT